MPNHSTLPKLCISSLLYWGNSQSGCSPFPRVCMQVHTCTWVHIMCYAHMPEDQRTTSGVLLQASFTLFLETEYLSLGSQIHQVSLARKAHRCAWLQLPSLGLQVHTLTPTFFMWVLRCKLGSSQLHDKHFSNQAIYPSHLHILLVTLYIL